jgi:hypothetical protein
MQGSLDNVRAWEGRVEDLQSSMRLSLGYNYTWPLCIYLYSESFLRDPYRSVKAFWRAAVFVSYMRDGGLKGGKMGE